MRRLAPPLLSPTVGGSSLVGEIAATSDWTSDLTFIPDALVSSLEATSTWIGVETYDGGAVVSLEGALGGSATWSGTVTDTFTSATILDYIDAALASMATVREEKVAALAAARILATRAALDLASTDLAYVDQVIRELNRARGLVVQYDEEA